LLGLGQHACGFNLDNDRIDTRSLLALGAQQYPKYDPLQGVGFGAV
jgi:hypothetical protein